VGSYGPRPPVGSKRLSEGRLPTPVCPHVEVRIATMLQERCLPDSLWPLAPVTAMGLHHTFTRTRFLDVSLALAEVCAFHVFGFEGKWPSVVWEQQAGP
jgi:hypothetical protein